MKDKNDVMNRLLKQDIDQSILNYIDESIKGISDKKEIAIAIYVKLAELFWYSPSFVVENDYSLIEELSHITVSHNEVICLHWAIIYSKLLDKYGIDNDLRGDDEHLYVRIKIEKYVIFADATKYGADEREYVLADLTNTKIGIKIKNFTTLSEERNKELYEIIDNVYDKLGIKYYDESRLEEILRKFSCYTRKKIAHNVLNEGYRIGREDILYRIRFINNFYRLNLKLREVERLQFFAKYYMRVFEGFNYDNCRCLTLNELGQDYKLVRLLVVQDDAKNNYYFLETDNGFIEYDKDKLVDEFIRRRIVFKYDICCVLGFEDSEVRMLSKKKVV